MGQYYFRTKEFGVTDSGIHLLRSGFNYETIAFSQIHKLEIKKEKEIHNWIGILVIGLILLAPGIYFAINIINVLIHGDISPRGARMVLLLLIPLVGVYFIYTSLQTGTILQINYGKDKKDQFPLRQIIAEKQMDDFKLLMKDKLSVKFRVTETRANKMHNQ
ncbi:MAG TPA: hypothetical protein VK589_13330 [Chryseolinea sp.]|nr:hypothetical protein [Chryseolinea sp.]